MLGANATVTIEHLTQGKDTHGAKVDAAPDETFAGVDAAVARASNGDLWKINVDGDFSRIALAPTEWRITDELGNVYGPVKATYRRPVGRIITESEHTLIFAERVGETTFADEGVT